MFFFPLRLEIWLLDSFLKNMSDIFTIGIIFFLRVNYVKVYYQNIYIYIDFLRTLKKYSNKHVVDIKKISGLNYH